MAKTAMGNVVKDFSKMTDEEKENYAALFCENDLELKKLLLKMWNADIQTYACCAGHNDDVLWSAGGLKESGKPYLYFDIKNFSDKKLKKLIASLMASSKTLPIVSGFEINLDKYMGFEKHGLTIRLNKDKNTYKLLNDVFDDVLENKNNLLKNIFKVFSLKNKKTLTEEDMQFIDSIVEMNKINFEEYSKSVASLGPEDRCEKIELDYSKNTGKQLMLTDAVKSEIFKIWDPCIGSYWASVSEGTYVKNPSKELYYTVVNGEIEELSKAEIVGLKPYKAERRNNYCLEYKTETFDLIMKNFTNSKVVDIEM